MIRVIFQALFSTSSIKRLNFALVDRCFSIHFFVRVRHNQNATQAPVVAPIDTVTVPITIPYKYPAPT